KVMSEQQVPQVSAMMGQLVAHQSGFNALPKSDRQFVLQEPKAAIIMMVDAICNRSKEPAPERTYSILRRIQPEPTPVATGPFSADNTFFSKKSGVNMVNHGDNFKTWYTGKVEEEAPEGMLIPLTLIQAAYDREIIADLGGEEEAEVTLTEIWRLMERQASGEKGDLLTNGWVNIFYVKDKDGVLRAVGVGWGGGGWGVRADALDDGQWRDGGQVFSRPPA
ncbi:MAG: hypothetical protein Q8O00_14795, partial [Holophaga sp.]|nr:hypothetical protein [Holophaga sp.]